MKKEVFNVVIDEELAATLDSLGELKKIENGEIFCCICSNLITLSNLQVIITEQNNILYICNKIECNKTLGSQGVLDANS